MGTEAADGYPADGEGSAHTVGRVDSRSANEPDSSTGNLGFRVAA